MKLYSDYANASVSMSKDETLRKLLAAAIDEERIDCVIETGTYDGTGSTTLIAESFPKASPAQVFITMEASWSRWRKATRNLLRFPNVTAVWGKSVSKADALKFIREDDFLRDHHKYPEIFIDNVDDPVAFYTRELRGKFADSKLTVADLIRKAIDRLFHYQGENLLRRYLVSYREKRPLIVLDSAGGIGLLEFSMVRETMDSRPYLLLLDDINHIKHYRSVQYICSDPSFTVLGQSNVHGWALAKHVGTSRPA
jgi:hypothetical protein